MATDTDLITLASLSETDGRRARDLPRGIGPAALTRLCEQKLAQQGMLGLADYYTRTANGTGVMRNNSGRLEILRRMNKLTAAQIAEVAAVTAPTGVSN